MKFAIIGILALLAGCSDPHTGQNGENFDLKVCLDEASEHLSSLMAKHEETWHIHSAKRWDADQDKGIITWTFDDATVEAPCQIIGTYNPLDRTFLWAWDNPSIKDSESTDAKKVLDFAKKHNIQTLQRRMIECDAETAMQLTALAVRECDRKGAYQGDAGNVIIFFTFGDVTIHHNTRETAPPEHD